MSFKFTIYLNNKINVISFDILELLLNLIFFYTLTFQINYILLTSDNVN